MENIEKYNWIIPIVEKHFKEISDEIHENEMLPKDPTPLNNFFRIGEIKEDLYITLANLVEYIKEEEAVQKEAESKGAEIWNNER